jgi:hypothetical protein
VIFGHPLVVGRRVALAALGLLRHGAAHVARGHHQVAALRLQERALASRIDHLGELRPRIGLLGDSGWLGKLTEQVEGGEHVVELSLGTTNSAFF